MNILFLTDNFPPESNAPANRTYEHCMDWVSMGANVTVITCAPNFPEGKLFDGYKNKLYQKETIDGIRVIRVWSYITANKGIKKRVLDYISFAIMAFFASFFIKTDIIIATSPQFFTAVSGNFAAFFKRKPWIMEVRDLWPESIEAVKVMRHTRWLNFLEKVELYLYRSANKVVVVTDSFKENLVSRNIPASKIEVVKNGVILKNFKNVPKDKSLLKSLGLEDKFLVGYIGTHGLAHKLDFILDCIKEIEDKSIHFLLIGGGAKKEELIQQQKKLGLTNLTMLPPVSREEIVPYISILDVSLVNLRKSKTFKAVIPSKIFENASMGKPILLGVEGECRSIVEEFNAGLYFEPENKEDFLNKLKFLRNNPDQYQEYKKAGLRLAKAFNRNVFSIKMYDIIKSTIVTEHKVTAVEARQSKS